MFIRASDHDNIMKYNSFFNFINAKRKGHQIIKFRLIKNEFDYFESQLDIKYIGKNELDILQNIPIKLIFTQTSSLIFQSFDDNKLNFITMDDDGELVKTPVNELETGLSLALYNKETQDYILDDITMLLQLNSDDSTIFKNLDIEDMSIPYKNAESNLSKYIMSTNNNEGMIINNFMII